MAPRKKSTAFSISLGFVRRKAAFISFSILERNSSLACFISSADTPSASAASHNLSSIVVNTFFCAFVPPAPISLVTVSIIELSPSLYLSYASNTSNILSFVTFVSRSSCIFFILFMPALLSAMS